MATKQRNMEARHSFTIKRCAYCNGNLNDDKVCIDCGKPVFKREYWMEYTAKAARIERNIQRARDILSKRDGKTIWCEKNGIDLTRYDYRWSTENKCMIVSLRTEEADAA